MSPRTNKRRKVARRNMTCFASSEFDLSTRQIKWSTMTFTGERKEVIPHNKDYP